MPDSLLAIDHLSVAYQTDRTRRLALDDVSLALRPSEILGIVGESGCGKSTLGMSILRLLPQNGHVMAGTIALQGHGDLGILSDEQMRSLRGREIAIIFQDPATSLNPRLPVGLQMLQVQRAHAIPAASAKSLRDNAISKLAEVGLPSPAQAFQRYPHEFSGGMRQRVMIAMALLFEPKLIIADEATSALDVTLEAQILELLLRLRDAHDTAILFISHDLGVVSQLCDRVAVMYAGRVVEQTSAEAVLASPRHPYTQALGVAVPNRRSRGQRLVAIDGHVPDLTKSAQVCSFEPRCIYARPVCTERAPDLYASDSVSVRCFAYAPAAGGPWPAMPSAEGWRRRAGGNAPSQEQFISDRSGQLLLDVRELAVHYGSVGSRAFGPMRSPIRAVDGVSLTISPGRIFGIVGESGSGKTTLGEAIVKLLPPTSGSILFGGRDVTRMSARETFAFRRRAQMIFQNPYSSLSPRMQVGSQLIEPYEIHKLPRSQRQSADELLSAVGLASILRTAYPSQLSGGEARRVGIARALALEPDLVVADEPTAGLDASAAAATMNLLTDLRQRVGLTVVLISHNLSLVTTAADEVCVMYLGQVVERGETGAVTGAPAHPYTRALLALAPDPEHSSRITRRRLLIPGEIPSPDDPPAGCRFHPRCPYSQEICREVAPVLAPAGNTGNGHVAACHFTEEIQSGALAPRGSEPSAGSADPRIA